VPRLALPLWPAAVVVGLAAERAAFGWGDVRHWLPDLAVGWTFAGCGLVAWSRRPESRTGPLLAATGFTWFAGNFAGPLIYLHRGPLVHCLLAYPSGRLRSTLERAAVVAAYAVALVAPIARSETATIALAVVVVAVAFRGYITAVGRDRRARRPALWAVSLLGLVLAAGAVARLAFPAGDASDVVLLAYEGALVAVAIGLLIGLLRAPWERAPVADFVVELGELPSGTLRDSLARALGDPSLMVGYWLPDTGIYVGSDGTRLELPAPGEPRAVTRVERDGHPLAALVHDPVVLDDPGLVEGVAAAARLAAANARLQAEVQVQLADVRASRRRLLQAADEERRRLELRVRERSARRLAGLADSLADARSAAGPAARQRIEQAESQLARTLADLHELALGLHPRALAEEGLEGALAGLAARSPVTVELDVAAGRLPPEIEAAAYFVCSEALTNAAKHAFASRIAVRVARRERFLEVEITDDGAGGVDPTRGSGLRGLENRVEALGGTLRVESAPSSGTRLQAVIPLEGERLS
jgi:signal transduction histidine kinase